MKDREKYLEYHRKRYWAKRGITELPEKRPTTKAEIRAYRKKKASAKKKAIKIATKVLIELGDHWENDFKDNLKKAAEAEWLIRRKELLEKSKSIRSRGSPISTKYRKLLYSAAISNRPVSITLEEYEIISKKNCCYCHNKIISTGHGLDRIDNSKGYEKDNVVSCCGPCNMLKGRFLTSDELILILNYRKLKV